MAASESSPLASNLQESIEHLIAETVRRSQSDNQEETKHLQAVMQQAVTEIEAGQSAMNRAAELLRSALKATKQPVIAESPDGEAVEATPESDVESVAIPEPEEVALTAGGSERGPHQLDVIAHDVTIGIATNLQKLLRNRKEVTDAQTREFVNGELRLKLDMASSLNMAVINDWLTEHKGKVTTHTDSVLELRFEN